MRSSLSLVDILGEIKALLVECQGEWVMTRRTSALSWLIVRWHAWHGNTGHFRPWLPLLASTDRRISVLHSAQQLIARNMRLCAGTQFSLLDILPIPRFNMSIV
jgi:hypothetical protein